MNKNERKVLICVVCGSTARGFNFGAITCMSCKIFFRRNAFENLNRFQCQENGRCQINQQTRRHCTFCRLLLCFRVGMNRKLIRFSHPTEKRTIPKNFLSTSSNDFRWVLFCLSSSFENLNSRVVSKSNEIFQRISSIGVQPMKIRSKAFHIHEFHDFLAENALDFLRSIPHSEIFSSFNVKLSVFDRLQSFVLFYIFYQINGSSARALTQTPFWKSSFEFIFEDSTRQIIEIIFQRISLLSAVDSHLIQLFLVLILFNSSPHVEENFSRFNLDLTIKYLNKQFSEFQSIRLILSIVETNLQIENLRTKLEQSQISSETKFFSNIKSLIEKQLSLIR